MKKHHVLLVFAVAVSITLIVFFAAPLRFTALSRTTEIAQMYALETAAKISMSINASVDHVSNYSYLLTHLVETDLIATEKKREFALAEMELRYNNIKALSNIWCIFEPNAFDGLDEHFKNTNKGDEHGIFNPWFVDGGLIYASGTREYEQVFYKIPKQTRKQTITDPYWENVGGKSILMVSYAKPVFNNDAEFIGVVGSDFYVENLSALISIQRIVGRGKLVTDNSIIVVHENPELIGEYDSHYTDNRIAYKLSYGKISQLYPGIFRVYAPVWIGENGIPWIFVVEVPVMQIYFEIIQSVGLLTIIFGLILVAVFLYFKTKEKNRELQKLHSTKDKLFSVVSHELRNALGSLMSLLKMSTPENLDAKLFALILKQIDDVYALIVNLLSWAKNQMHGLKISPIYFDVHNETYEISDSLHEIAAKKNIKLNNLIEKHKIYADRDIFSIVVRNLTTNAIKFTPEGGEVTLDAKLIDNMLVVSVKDTGIGMSQEVQDKLFNFSETKSQRGTKNEVGAGLGLILCADFVKANGGRIWFNSKQGVGTTFFFSVPVASD